MLDKQIDIVAMKVHDCFNIIAISFICATNSLFLYHATDFSKVGTEYLGQGHELVFNRLLVAFSIYLVIDAVWVLCVPNCIPSDPFGIFVHHLATFLIVLIPANLTQFSWHMGIALLVEFNTLFLMLKRNINKDSVFGLVFELMFYLSWIVLRLIMYPIFTVFIYYEYLRYSALVKSNINVMAGGFVLILFLTGLGFKWTVDMLIKMRGRTTTTTTKNE
jgi:hypothetical protein